MLKERARLIALSIFSLDLFLVIVAFFLSYWLRSTILPGLAPSVFANQLYPLADYLPFLPLALLIWGALLLSSGRYRSHRTVPILDEAWAIIRVCVWGLVIFTLVLYASRVDELLLGQDEISRAWVSLFAVVACLLLLSEKLFLRVTSRYVRTKGFNYRTVAIVGTNQTAVDIAESIDSHRYWGYRILGFITQGGEVSPRLPRGYPVLGDVSDICAIVDSKPVDDVVFAVHRRDLDRMEDTYLRLEERGIQVRFALNFFPHTRAKVQLEELDGLPLLTFSTAPTNHLQLAAKRAVDIAASALLLALGLPVVLAIALAIRVTSGGQVLFRQTRCGLNGRMFTLYKFRTMVEDAEARRKELLHLNRHDGPVFKVPEDPRITGPVGRFLRKFSLDELPQLWNVLRGDMSLVGPRPPIPEEVAQYKPWQRRRLSMKPGLTCLWQISGRNEIDFNRWIELDLEYIDSWTPLLDFKILFKTIPVVLSGRGAS
ncbi:MAG: sugar transferase [Acidobacteria bacterium]|nr:sugar transferase [Acidobacteriota bacterium]